MLVITSGDPLSVNVEAMALLLRGFEREYPVVVIGSLWQWKDQCTRLGVDLPSFENCSLDQVASSGLFFHDVDDGRWNTPAEEMPEKERGRLAVTCFDVLEKYREPSRFAVLTLPIDKHACRLGGFKPPGQTEFFEKLWRDTGVMFLAGPKLRVGLATNHYSLVDVPKVLSGEVIKHRLDAISTSLRELFGIKSPKIAVCALNPHAGDGGMFGSEDDKLVKPAVREYAELNPDVQLTGPLAADTLFFRAYRGEFDAVLAMYHDQGLGPLKTVHFDEAVNITGGLKHLRLSPDHGPAKDLFLKGSASNKSYRACLELADAYLSGVNK